MLFGVYPKAAVSQLTNEGWKYYFRGLLPQICHRTTQISLMFSIFEGTNKYLKKNYQLLDGQALILSATLTGTCESFLTPFERIQVLLLDPIHHDKFKNSSDVIKKIVHNGGVRELYRGYNLVLTKNIIHTLGYFYLKQRLIPQDLSRYSQSVQFALKFGEGALIGAVLTTITYPLNVVKIANQRRLDVVNQTTLEVFMSIYNTRGKISRIYQGVSFTYVKATLHWAILNVAYFYFRTFADRF